MTRDKELAKQGIEQGTFDFLGFTFYLGKSRAGRVIPKLRTKAKSYTAKLNKVTIWIKKVRNELPIKEIWKIFTAKLRGHVQYYGMSFNTEKVDNFLRKAVKIVYKWLNRRSQRKSFSWEKFNKFIKLNPLPVAKVIHSLF